MTTNLTSTLRYAVIAILACFSTTSAWAGLVPVKSLEQLNSSKKYYIQNVDYTYYVYFQTSDYTETHQVNATGLCGDPLYATQFKIESDGNGGYTISDGEYYVTTSSTLDSDNNPYYWNTIPSVIPESWTLTCTDGIFTIAGANGKLWKAETQEIDDDFWEFVYLDGTAENSSTWRIYEYENEVELDQSLLAFAIPNMDPDDVQVTVNLRRTAMAAGKSNTICLPFDMSAEQIADTFGENTKVYAFANSVADRITYTYATNIEAGVPYIISPDKDLYDDYYVIHHVNVSSFTTQIHDVTRGEFTLYGTYNKIEPAPSDIYTYSDGKIYHYTQASSISGFRAYFHSKNPGAKINTFAFEDETDGIAEIVEVLEKSSLGVYNVNGQLVRQTSDNLEGLTPGVYVVNGKKVLVK